MEDNRITLLVDGNYFINSRMRVLPRNKRTKNLIDDEDDKKMLLKKLLNDTAYEFRRFENIIDEIIFTFDYKSWRYQYLKEYNKRNQESSVSYKGQRKQNNTHINWNNVREVSEEFCNVLKQSNVKIHNVKGAEADDLIYWWSTRLNDQGRSCIIWTRDQDLVQLVNYNPSTDSYTLYYNAMDNQLIVYPGFQKWIENEEDVEMIDIFDVDHTMVSKHKVKDFYKNLTSKIESIFCDEFLFLKVLEGDTSDNIESVWTWQKEQKNGTVTKKITENQAKKYLEKFKKNVQNRFSREYFFQTNFIREIAKIVADDLNINDQLDEVINRLNRNIKIIVLHNNTIPENVLNDIDDSLNELNENRNIKKYLKNTDRLVELTDWDIGSKKQIKKTDGLF